MKKNLGISIVFLASLLATMFANGFANELSRKNFREVARFRSHGELIRVGHFIDRHGNPSPPVAIDESGRNRIVYHVNDRSECLGAEILMDEKTHLPTVLIYSPAERTIRHRLPIQGVWYRWDGSNFVAYDKNISDKAFRQDGKDHKAILRALKDPTTKFRQAYKVFKAYAEKNRKNKKIGMLKKKISPIYMYLVDRGYEYGEKGYLGPTFLVKNGAVKP